MPENAGKCRGSADAGSNAGSAAPEDGGVPLSRRHLPVMRPTPLWTPHPGLQGRSQRAAAGQCGNRRAERSRGTAHLRHHCNGFLFRERGFDYGQRHRAPPGAACAHHGHPRPGHLHYRVTAWLWGLTTSRHSGLQCGPAPPTWLPWSSRRLWFRSGSRRPERGSAVLLRRAQSKYQVDTVQGIWRNWATPAPVSFADTNDMASVTRPPPAASDVIYVPPTTPLQQHRRCGQHLPSLGIPIIAGEEGHLRRCGVATLSSALRHRLQDRRDGREDSHRRGDISAMPIEYAPQFTKKYNETICSDLDLTPLEGLRAHRPGGE